MAKTKKPTTKASSKTNTSDGRRYAEPKFVSLQPGQVTHGDVKRYGAYASILTVGKKRTDVNEIHN